MKKTKFFGGFIAFTLAATALIGCGPTSVKYTVKFTKGTEVLKETVYEAGSVIEAPADPASYVDEAKHLSYTFDAWYEDSTAKTGKFVTGTTATKNVTYDAAFISKDIEYTVTFKLSEDDQNPTLKKGIYGADLVAPSDPARKEGTDHYYYVFDGWYNGQSKYVAGTTKITGNVTYIAKFVKDEAIKYDVTFNLETPVVKQISIETLTIDAPAIPATAHYDSVWKSGNKVVASEGSITFTESELKAWTFDVEKTAIQYDVEFKVDDSVVATKKISAESLKITTPEITPVTGYTIKWSDGENLYDGGAEITFTKDQLHKWTFNQVKTANKYTIKFVNRDDSEIATKSLAYDSVIAATDVPEDPASYVEGFDDMVFDAWKNGEVTLVPGTTKVAGDATYKATFKNGGEHTFTATVKQGETPLGTVEYKKSTWATKRADVLGLLPAQTEAKSYTFESLVDASAPKDPTYQVRESSTYFSTDLSSASALDDHFLLMDREDHTKHIPSLSFNEANKTIDMSILNANVWVNSYVKDYEVEFNVKSSADDRIVFLMGLQNIDSLNKGYAGAGANCKDGVIGIIIAPNNASSGIRIFANGAETQVQNANYLNNYTLTPMSNGIKVNIGVANGAISISVNDTLLTCYTIPEAAGYNGGYIGFARGNTGKAYSLYNNFKVSKAFNDFFDYQFDDANAGRLNVNGRCGARTGSTPSKLEVADGTLVATSGNGNAENMYTSRMYKDFVFEAELKTTSADGKVSFFVMNKLSDLGLNAHESGANMTGGNFRAIIAADHASGIVRPNYNGAEKSSQKLDTSVTFKSMANNYVKIKMIVNDGLVSIYLADDVNTNFIKEGEFQLDTTGTNAYVGGFVGVSFKKVTTFNYLKISAIN